MKDASAQNPSFEDQSPSDQDACDRLPANQGLIELEELIKSCKGCPLFEGRTQVVFGDGNPEADVLIIGEAPGKNEYLQGKPFVGAAGKYLNELLEMAGLDREDVYIANVVKCRPPGNRNPKAEEIEACAPYLRQQTRLIDPKFIVTLGNFSTRFILKTEQGITNLRGRVFQAGRFQVFPVFHPAAAIYDRRKREILEQDFKTLGAMLSDAGSGSPVSKSTGSDS